MTTNELEKIEDLKKIEEIANQLINKVKDCLLICDKSQKDNKIAQDFEFNLFTYSSITHSSCYGTEGKFSALITSLTEDELKQKMRKYADLLKNKFNYCHHDFLKSINDFGIYLCSSESIEFFNNNLKNEICLEKITLQDIYGPEKYSEIIKEKEEEENRQRLIQNEIVRKAREAKERQQYEELKAKFG